MAVSDEQIEQIKDMFADLGGLSTRKMMGGLAIYHEGTVFALLHSSGQLYLKGADGYGEELEALGSTRWSYQKKDSGKEVKMPYWTLPESALDDPEEACTLARAALARL
ncbi:TfoX/Sxy family protein [Lentibacter algarum]|uniref:TfoX/Sxy family protein n=1 Tax=Lentibacter algarum TaxID=576131 RepID=UPI001C0808A5|nr:TfoX/Sxy family protein [Lentibacter algarum]MBU2982573.1 TfoX/Sxy family protein [Lentibacter algarum]